MISSVKIIEDALNNIGSGYHRVRTSYSTTGIIRERVFCYELYHQIRLLMGEQPLLSLCGEIDKSGHPSFEKAHRKNPDFILHNAGDFKNNELVIEVKGSLIKKDIKKDFETINSFITKYEYQYGIFILYNFDLNEFTSKFLEWYSEELTQFIYSADRVYIMCKKNGYNKTQVINLRDLIECNFV